MKIGLLCLPLIGGVACGLEDGTPDDLDALAGREQAVAVAPELWCAVGVPNNQGAAAPGSCSDPSPGSAVGPKVIAFTVFNDPIPIANFEFRWHLPKKLSVLSGCTSTSRNCGVSAPTNTTCGDTKLTAKVTYRDTRSPSNPWRTLTATAHLKLGNTKACLMAALDQPTCLVYSGICSGTYREKWLWAVASTDTDDTQRTSVGISYTNGNEWCTWSTLAPGQTESWLVTVPAYTLIGRVQTETDWDISPYCNFVLNAMTCSELDP